jgi:hypothetical protein
MPPPALLVASHSPGRNILNTSNERKRKLIQSSLYFACVAVTLDLAEMSRSD